MKKIIILFLCLFCLLIVPAKAQDTEQQKADLQKKIQEYENKLTEIRQEKNTLSSQIDYMDTQIYLTGLRIEDTEKKISDTQHEIELISSKIEGLDTSLDYLSKLLLQRMVEGYKTRAVTIFDIVFDSNNANDFINEFKYYKTTRDNNQKLLVQVQETKLNFEDQKTLREKKKIELDKLSQTLETQKVSLKQQQEAKKNLLAATQNDETSYQSLLQKAKAELSGFTSFAKAAGGGLTSFGSGSNNWYFTQRDPQWGNSILPGSSSSVSLAGCAVTSIAMVCKSYGQDISPASIVSNSNNFINGDLWNWAFNCNGKSQRWLYSPSQDDVRSLVNRNIPVILRLVAPSVSGLHFIVVWKWDTDKNDFIIHDPYYGPDIPFSERYSWSQITTGIVIQ